MRPEFTLYNRVLHDPGMEAFQMELIWVFFM